MTKTQLTLLLEYISNEISLQTYCVNPNAQERVAIRNNLKDMLLKSVEESETIITKPESKDSPPPHDDPNNKFSPLMIDMLMFVGHSGHRFHTYPNVELGAQQASYHWFLDNNYFSFELVGHKPTVKLTYKGQALVDKILNTTVY
jgi:hypothetical protein